MRVTLTESEHEKTIQRKKEKKTVPGSEKKEEKKSNNSVQIQTTLLKECLFVISKK